jgi:uncharacterized lipoprotein YajG
MLMIKNRKSSLAALAAIGASLLLAGCQTPSDVAEADAKPDPRQGAEVKQYLLPEPDPRLARDSTTNR